MRRPVGGSNFDVGYYYKIEILIRLITIGFNINIDLNFLFDSIFKIYFFLIFIFNI